MIKKEVIMDLVQQGFNIKKKIKVVIIPTESENIVKYYNDN